MAYRISLRLLYLSPRLPNNSQLHEPLEPLRYLPSFSPTLTRFVSTPEQEWRIQLGYNPCFRFSKPMCLILLLFGKFDSPIITPTSTGKFLASISSVQSRLARRWLWVGGGEGQGISRAALWRSSDGCPTVNSWCELARWYPNYTSCSAATTATTQDSWYGRYHNTPPAL